MSLVYLRMYRIQSVFFAYEEYLKWQRKFLLSNEVTSMDKSSEFNTRASGL